MFVPRELDHLAWGQGSCTHLREGETCSWQEAAEDSGLGQSPRDTCMGAQAFRPTLRVCRSSPFSKVGPLCRERKAKVRVLGF